MTLGDGQRMMCEKKGVEDEELTLAVLPDECVVAVVRFLGL